MGRGLADRDRVAATQSTAEARAPRATPRCASWSSDSFAEFAERIAPARTPDLRLLGTSGTVTTLASLHLDLPQYDRARGRRADRARRLDARHRRSRCRPCRPSERRELPCIGNERAGLVVAGCAILEAILDIWPADAPRRRRPRHPRRHPAQPDGGRCRRVRRAQAALRRQQQADAREPRPGATPTSGSRPRAGAPRRRTAGSAASSTIPTSSRPRPKATAAARPTS